MAEGRLAEFAHGHDPSGNGIGEAGVLKGLSRQVFSLGQQLLDPVGRLEAVAEDIDAKRGQGLCFFPSLFQ